MTFQLANLLESDTWKTSQALFSVQELIDDVVPEVLPAMKRKGLQLLINNALPAGEQRYGDREALRRTLVLLIQYSITTTPIGKITLDVCRDESASDRLTFRILDTGNGGLGKRDRQFALPVSQRDPERSVRQGERPHLLAVRPHERANWVGS